MAINIIDTSTETNGNSNNTNNTIVGTADDDIITAGPATEQYYIHPQTGKLSLVQDNDTITESLGINTLTGGYGNDKFIFNIGLSATEGSLHTESFMGGVNPDLSGANANGMWHSYLNALAAWRAQMEIDHGADADTTTETATYTWSAGKNNKIGTATWDETYSYYKAGEVTTNTSYNTITDYGNGNDEIHMAGVTQAEFTAAGGTVIYNGTNTVIQVGNFTIVVNGVELTAADLIWG